MSRVLFEYLAVGHAVVASRVGVVPEVLEDGKTALLVPAGEPRRSPRPSTRSLADGDAARARSAPPARASCATRLSSDPDRVGARPALSRASPRGRAARREDLDPLLRPLGQRGGPGVSPGEAARPLADVEVVGPQLRRHPLGARGAEGIAWPPPIPGRKFPALRGLGAAPSRAGDGDLVYASQAASDERWHRVPRARPGAAGRCSSTSTTGRSASSSALGAWRRDRARAQLSPIPPGCPGRG